MEVLAHQCQPPDLQRRQLVQPPPQRDQTSAVLPTLEVVQPTDLTLAMQRVPQWEQQAAQAIVPPSRREIALKSDRGLTLAMA
ncbi:MAG: hypothetical protein JWP89_4179 [Schlesneria sp.]|nr:hypothetical protein [Schlesneria sp.]